MNPVPDNALSLSFERASRRRGTDHSVELSSADGRMEARARAGGRLHLRAEAGGADTADRAGNGELALPSAVCRPASSTSSPDLVRRAGAPLVDILT